MNGLIKAFDGVKEIVYAADTDNYELLFLNKAGMEALGIEKREQLEGRKCYEVLQGKEYPCTYCTNGQLCREQFLEWEHENPITGRRYCLKDKLIEWGNRNVRIEIADEITDFGAQNAEAKLQRETEREQIVMECIKMMYSSVETDVAINNTLETLGKYLHGERTYVFHVHGKYMDNTYEWCAEGVSREKESLQKIPISTIDRWMPYFYRNECVIIQDVEMIKEAAPEEYAVLKPQKIESLITVPIIGKGNFIGYFGVDNPKAGNLEETSNILKMLAYFFQSLLERKKREDYLKKIGLTDEMTGALNRNAYIRDTMPDNNRELVSAGGFFIDINGLKRTNDTYGHEAGDRLIRKIYQIIHSAVRDFPIYRLGGDEFAVLCPNISKMKLDEMESRLRQELDGRNGCSAAVGANFIKNPSDLSGIMDEADRRMYQDKQEYYRRNGVKVHP